MTNSRDSNKNEILYNYLRGIDWQTANHQPYLENHRAEKKQLLMKIAGSKTGKQVLIDLLFYVNNLESQRQQQKRYNLFTTLDEKSDNEWIQKAVEDALYYANKLAPVKEALPEIFANDQEEYPLQTLKL